MDRDYKFSFQLMSIVAVGCFIAFCATGYRAWQHEHGAGVYAQAYRNLVDQYRTLEIVAEDNKGYVDALLRKIEKRDAKIADLNAATEYVDEANIRGDFPSTEELGKVYPRIIIDGVKCDYDPDQKWFVHADLRCRVMWMGIGDQKILMDRVDFRDHEGEPFTNQDGDILIEMHPLKIMENGKWRLVKQGDPIHKYAATALGLQKKDETPERDTLSRLGRSEYWAEFDGETWKLADTAKFPDDVKAGLGGGVSAEDVASQVERIQSPQLVAITYDAPQEAYVDDKDLPRGTFDPKKFSRIVGGYRSVQFDCPVSWQDDGAGRELCDGSDFRDENYEPKIGDPANIDGDNRIIHREGRLQIMDGGVWRDVKPGDKLRQMAVDTLIRLNGTEIYKEGAVRQIGTSGIYARLGTDAWYIIEGPRDVSAELLPNQTTLRLAAVQVQYDKLISQLNIIDGQISEKSKELSALIKERKRLYDHAPTLRKAIKLLTVEKPE